MSFLDSQMLRSLLAGFVLLSGSAFAQNETIAEEDQPAAQGGAAGVVDDPAPASPTAAANSSPANPSTGTRGGVVSLQTTVTGNQEQPRVLYILPWQSPAASDVDFELLDSQQTSVFGHIERNELRRELEAAGEFD